MSGEVRYRLGKVLLIITISVDYVSYPEAASAAEKIEMNVRESAEPDLNSKKK
jgi:hypothetical protein